MKTLFIGQQLIETDVVDSTNNFTTNLLNATNMPEGTVIMAREQTSGKGQRGSSWISEPGKNLTVSVVLYPGFLSVNRQFLISVVTALAVCEAISSETENVFIKWPNDIYIGKKKVAGILIENVLEKNRVKSSVIGIGVNVNQVLFPGINATSVAAEKGSEQNLRYWLEKICSELEAAYLVLRAGKEKELMDKYLDRLLYYREERTFFVNGSEITGTITGVSEEGKLILLEKDKSARLFDIKEVSFLI